MRWGMPAWHPCPQPRESLPHSLRAAGLKDSRCPAPTHSLTLTPGLGDCQVNFTSCRASDRLSTNSYTEKVSCTDPMTTAAARQARGSKVAIDLPGEMVGQAF